MTDDQKFKALAKELINLRREVVRIKAGITALQVVVRHPVPKRQLAAWDAAFAKLISKYVQRQLEDLEKVDAEYAAWIDDRDIDDVNPE